MQLNQSDNYFEDFSEKFDCCMNFVTIAVAVAFMTLIARHNIMFAALFNMYFFLY